MKTKFWSLDKINKEEVLQEAAQVLRSGGVVAFPTETVYGLGADGLSQQAVEKIFAAKGRPADNPLILHIADKQEIYGLVSEVPLQAELLMEEFWPGPLTIIFKKKEHIPKIVTAGLDTVAIRMPANEIANRLISLSGTPLAAPSANLSGKPSPTEAAAVEEDLNSKIDGIIDGGKAQFGLESTVVDCTGELVAILRPGSITEEQLEKIVAIKKNVSPLEGAAPKAPGMKYRHYAPKAPVYILSEGLHKEDIVFFCTVAQKRGLKVGCIAEKNILTDLPDGVTSQGGWQDEQGLTLLAKNLYSWLREFDKGQVDVILAQAVLQSGLGVAIMNRLEKAAQEKRIFDKIDFGKILPTLIKDL